MEGGKIMVEKILMAELDSVLTKRGFIWGPYPEIYGGASGFYSLGPQGKLLKNNTVNIIRKIYYANGFGEIETPIISPRIVWEASGHLERFVDPVSECEKCKNIYRTDKLIEEFEPELTTSSASIESLNQIIIEKGIKCPKCGGNLLCSTNYNLMQKTFIGNLTEAYLRPETATGTYVLFKNLLNDNRKKLPIKVFQTGRAFRNEISPRQGFLRLREFDQFEAQIFTLHKQQFEIDEFEQIKEEVIPLVPSKNQMDGNENVIYLSCKDAIDKSIIKKQIYTYCFYLTKKIIKTIGFKDGEFRYRQHLPDEKAHYAEDAWDLECLSKKYGWIEVCGVHDRGNFDLSRHNKFSNEKMTIQIDDKEELPVIFEIAFGIERLVYLMLEKSFKIDEKYNRTLLELPLNLAPITVGILPLLKNNEKLVMIAKNIYNTCLKKGLICFYDDIGSIGKRYRRLDEIGTPFCITVDHETIETNTVTIRERDSTLQKRVDMSDVWNYIENKQKE